MTHQDNVFFGHGVMVTLLYSLKYHNIIKFDATTTDELTQLNELFGFSAADSKFSEAFGSVAGAGEDVSLVPEAGGSVSRL